MKYWSLIVVFIYCLILAVCLPAIEAIIMPHKSVLFEFPFRKADDFWGAMGIIALFGLAQFTMLRLPVAISKKRQIPQRSVHFTIITAALMMAVLIFGLIIGSVALINLFNRYIFVAAVVIAIIFWGFWSWYFYRVTAKDSAPKKVKKMQTYLWSGSALELIVALGVHIAIRGKKTCCADWMNFIGIVCGFSVMVFAFGPSLYFLIRARINQLRPSADYRSQEDRSYDEQEDRSHDEEITPFKYWPFIVTILYCIILTLALYGIETALFSDIRGLFQNIFRSSRHNIRIFSVIAVIGLAQYGLLSIPIALSKKRPVSQRSVHFTVISAAFMMSLFMSSFIFLAGMSLRGKSFIFVLIAFLVSWGIWVIPFYRMTRQMTITNRLKKIQSFLWSVSSLVFIVGIAFSFFPKERGLHIASLFIEMFAFLGSLAGFAVLLSAFTLSSSSIIVKFLNQRERTPEGFIDTDNPPLYEEENVALTFIFLKSFFQKIIKTLKRLSLLLFIKLGLSIKHLVDHNDFPKLLKCIFLLPLHLKNQQVLSSHSFAISIKLYSFFMGALCFGVSMSLQLLIHPHETSILLDLIAALSTWLIFLVSFYALIKVQDLKVIITQVIIMLWAASWGSLCIHFLIYFNEASMSPFNFIQNISLSLLMLAVSAIQSYQQERNTLK